MTMAETTQFTIGAEDGIRLSITKRQHGGVYYRFIMEKHC
jgi:hypothetical protein